MASCMLVYVYGCESDADHCHEGLADLDGLRAVTCCGNEKVWGDEDGA